jgi:hypothetical protein
MTGQATSRSSLRVHTYSDGIIEASVSTINERGLAPHGVSWQVIETLLACVNGGLDETTRLDPLKRCFLASHVEILDLELLRSQLRSYLARRKGMRARTGGVIDLASPPSGFYAGKRMRLRDPFTYFNTDGGTRVGAGALVVCLSARPNPSGEIETYMPLRRVWASFRPDELVAVAGDEVELGQVERVGIPHSQLRVGA